MQRSSILLLLLFASLVASNAHAQVVWSGDFETGDASQYHLVNGVVADEPLITVVTDIVAGGVYGSRIELRNEARWPNGLKRVELHHSPAEGRVAEGQELFFAWSFYLPETLSIDPAQTIGYWESHASYRQIMAFRLVGDQLSFLTSYPSYAVHWTGTVNPQEWHRIAMRVLWSTSADSGRVDVWFDGEHVVTDAHAATLADSNPAFVQFGLIRGPVEFTDRPVIYIDEALEGNSLEDVHGISPPSMPDAGLPDAGMDASADSDASMSMETDAGSMSQVDADSTSGIDASTSRVDAGSITMPGNDCACRAMPIAHSNVSSFLMIGIAMTIAIRRRLRRP